MVQVIDAQTLKLADGRFVRLIGTYVPNNLSVPDAFDAASRAAALLRQAALGRKVEVRHGGRKQDRYGAHLAHVVAAEGKQWLQERLIASGLALFASQADNRACAEDLLAAEAVARRQRKGLWKTSYFKILPAAEAVARRQRKGLWKTSYFKILPAADARAIRQALDSFQIVEGKVANVSDRGSRTFINFGKDWRRDFTIRVLPGAKKQFKAAGIDLAALQGKTVRVRGWLTLANGPLIEINHPEQLEMLSAQEKRALPD